MSDPPTEITFREPKPRKHKGTLEARMAKLRKLKRDCAGHQANPRLAHVICSNTSQVVVTYRHPEKDEPVTVRQCTPHRKDIVKAGWEILDVVELGPLGPPPNRR